MRSITARTLLVSVVALACTAGLLSVPAATAAPAPEAAAPRVSPAVAAPGSVAPTAVAPAAVAPGSLRITTPLVTGGLSFPVAVTSARDGVDRLFVAELAGRIRVVQGGAITGTYLDISGIVATGGERGLLGLAFAPDFATSRYLFVTYTRSDGALVLARFRAASAGSATVSPATRQTVMVIPHPTYDNHNGGNIVFGRDGYLYLGTGDGGGAGDPGDNAQDLTTRLGKILRIDISCSASLYCIPPGNPYKGSTTRKQSIWMSGVRNPWRFSFDTDGTIYVADVGQDRREEVTIVGPSAQAGLDLGWSYKEGRLVYRADRKRDGRTYRDPSIQLCHRGTEYNGCRFGRSITGGFVYRGSADPEAVGTYVFADWAEGRVWGWRGGAWTPGRSLAQVTGFGLDDRRELYAVTSGGTLHRIRFAVA